MPANAIHAETRPGPSPRDGARSAGSAKPAPSGTTPARGLAARMSGPGGCYNLGNILALVAGLVVQIVSMPDGAANFLSVAGHYLFGSVGSTTLSAAILLFMASGELYHRAWENGAPPDARLNRLGDLLSGVASLVLTAALVMFGDIFLAIVSGVLLAGGKFGSAFVPEGPFSSRFREAVLFSRLPAIAALAVQLVRELAAGAPGAPLAATLMPIVMIACYLIWARADWLLLRPAPAAGVRES